MSDRESQVSRSRSRSPVHERDRYSRSRSYSRGRERSRRRDYYESRRYSRSRSRSYSPYSRGYRRRSPVRRRRSRSFSPMSSRKRHLGNRENPKASRCVGVFGLSLYTHERDIRQMFEKYGEIEDVQLVYDRQTGRSRGFCFIYYKNLEDSIEAKERAAGMELDGARIRVDFSITERAHTPTPGIYLGKPSRRGGYRDYRRSYRRTPSPYYRRSRYSRSRSRSYSPRRY